MLVCVTGGRVIPIIIIVMLLYINLLLIVLTCLMFFLLLLLLLFAGFSVVVSDLVVFSLEKGFFGVFAGKILLNFLFVIFKLRNLLSLAVMFVKVFPVIFLSEIFLLEVYIEFGCFICAVIYLEIEEKLVTKLLSLSWIKQESGIFVLVIGIYFILIIDYWVNNMKLILLYVRNCFWNRELENN